MMAVADQPAVIVVNGEPRNVESRVISWETVVDLAFPGERSNADLTFIVTYEKTEQSKHDGTLAVGGTVKVKKDGTVFYVAKHRRS
jgi:hypothetical protein